MNEDSIKRLLRSPVEADKIIGVEFSINSMGRQWCKNNFRTDIFPSKEKILLEYDEFVVYIGQNYIEYWEEGGYSNINMPHPLKRAYTGDIKIINNKTNDKFKTTSESTSKV